jgi:hypothetical protein
MADNQFPNCTQDLCARNAGQIQQVCKDSNFPPGSPVLVYSPTTGGWCYCYCGGQPQLLGAEIDTSPTVGPCGIAICNYDPAILKACSGLPAGTPILRTGHDQPNCKCYCWDGELAPYQVLDGNAQYVTLDTLPAGGFVMAAGLGLDWIKVLVRSASRPAQAIPQPAVEIVVGEHTVVVPRSHLFLTFQKTLITAAQLDPRIALMGADKQPIAVDSVTVGEQNYVFQFIETSQDVVSADLNYHLLDMYGVVTCDDAIRQAYLAGTLPASLLALPYPK